jgi:hypothetical protein
MRRARDVVESTQDALPEGMPGTQERLQELDAFYEALIESFLNVIDAWDAERHGSGRDKRDGARPSA